MASLHHQAGTVVRMMMANPPEEAWLSQELPPASSFKACIEIKNIMIS